MISVILPVFNAARFLERSIRSILQQTFREFELLIIDDGSTDRSPEIIRQFRDSRIRVIHHRQNQGISPTLNEALQQAQFPIIARQDADDISHPRRLEIQLNFLRRQPDLAIVGSQGWAMDERNRVRRFIYKPVEWHSLLWHQCFETAFVHTSVMFRKDIIQDIHGGYRPIPFAEDHDLWSRVLLQHRGANLPEALVYHRWHPASEIGRLGRGDTEKRFQEFVLPVMAEYYRKLFRQEISPEVIRQVVGGIQGFGRINHGNFPQQYGGLLEQFLAAFPAVRRSRDFHHLLAHQLLKVLRNDRGHLNFRTGLQFYRRLPVNKFSIFRNSMSHLLKRVRAPFQLTPDL